MTATPQQIIERVREGMALHQRGRLQEAARIYEQILGVEPQHFDALHLLGLVAAQSNQAQRGADLINRALIFKPDHPQALNNLGNCLQQLGRIDEALAVFDRAIAIKEDFPHAHTNRGNALLDLARPIEAIASFDKAIRLSPQSAVPHCNRGNALTVLGRSEDALASYETAIALDPNFVAAHLARGNSFAGLRRFEEAAGAYEQALKSDPRRADAWMGRGQALTTLGRAADALHCFDQAIALDAGSAQAQLARATTLANLGRPDEALQGVDKALALNPELTAAYAWRGFLRLDLKQYADAKADLKLALERDPNVHLGVGAYILACTHLCRWEEIEAVRRALVDAIVQGQNVVCHPLPLMCISDDPSLLRRCAELFAPPARPPVAFAPRVAGAKIRVGYFSTDFHDHPVSHLVAGLLEQHDRARFEVIAFSMGRKRDAWSARVEAATDRYIDLRERTTDEIVRCAREQALDVAVDLTGHSSANRTGLFAARVAPVQLSYLGFLGTMGAPYIDYIVADQAIAPNELRGHYTEKVIALPWYQCNEGQQQGAARAVRRDEHGLTEDAFVFCSFNNNMKLTREMFELWMRVLKRASNSVLWLYAEAAAVSHLREAAVRCGVDQSRLVFASKVPLQEHLARHRLADLALDTFPYNGGATGANALEAEVPVLSLRGRSFASRMGASLLSAVGLDALIADTAEAYEELAVRCAQDPDLVAKLRRILVENAHRKLFNIAAFARNIEKAYTMIVQRHDEGLEPDHFDLACLGSPGSDASAMALTR